MEIGHTAHKRKVWWRHKTGLTPIMVNASAYILIWWKYSNWRCEVILRNYDTNYYQQFEAFQSTSKIYSFIAPGVVSGGQEARDRGGEGRFRQATRQSILIRISIWIRVYVCIGIKIRVRRTWGWGWGWRWRLTMLPGGTLGSSSVHALPSLSPGRRFLHQLSLN